MSENGSAEKSEMTPTGLQPDEFEDLTFFRIVCGKPSLAKGLRKLKHLGRFLGILVAGAVENVEFKFDRREPVTHYCLFAIERRFVDLVVDSQVQ